MDDANRPCRTPALNPVERVDPTAGRGRKPNAPGRDVAAVGYEVIDQLDATDRRYGRTTRRGLASREYRGSVGPFYDDD